MLSGDCTTGQVIRTEKSELENERVALIEEVMDNKRRMKELEDNLLFRLTSVQVSEEIGRPFTTCAL